MTYGQTGLPCAWYTYILVYAFQAMHFILLLVICHCLKSVPTQTYADFSPQ